MKSRWMMLAAGLACALGLWTEATAQTVWCAGNSESLHLVGTRRDTVLEGACSGKTTSFLWEIQSKASMGAAANQALPDSIRIWMQLYPEYVPLRLCEIQTEMKVNGSPAQVSRPLWSIGDSDTLVVVKIGMSFSCAENKVWTEDGQTFSAFQADGGLAVVVLEAILEDGSPIFQRKGIALEVESYEWIFSPAAKTKPLICPNTQQSKLEAPEDTTLP